MVFVAVPNGEKLGSFCAQMCARGYRPQPRKRSGAIAAAENGFDDDRFLTQPTGGFLLLSRRPQNLRRLLLLLARNTRPGRRRASLPDHRNLNSAALPALAGPASVAGVPQRGARRCALMRDVLQQRGHLPGSIADPSAAASSQGSRLPWGSPHAPASPHRIESADAHLTRCRCFFSTYYSGMRDANGPVLCESAGYFRSSAVAQRAFDRAGWTQLPSP